MNDLIVAGQPLTPAVVYQKNGGVDEVLKRIKAEADAVIPDISTEQGRAEIRSLANKIARSKTALDAMGKDLVSDLKKQTGAIDAERKRIRDTLDALKEEKRRPLTEWENAEKDRVAGHEAAVADIAALASFDTPEPSLDEIRTRMERVRGDNRDWQEFAARAVRAKEEAMTALQSLYDAREKQETERAELARLRKEQEEREKRERDERIKAEAAEQARKEAEAKAERERIEAERKAKEEADRLEAERQAEAKAREEAEERVRQAEERHRQEIEKHLAWFGSAGTSDVPDDFPIASVDAQIQRADEILSSTDWQDRAADAQEAHRKAMERMKTMREHLEARQKEAAEKAAKEAEERAAQKERERIDAEKKAEADAAAKREADKKHRARINNEALGGLVAAGLTEDQGKAVVEAIAKGQIPNVKITY